MAIAFDAQSGGPLTFSGNGNVWSHTLGSGASLIVGVFGGTGGSNDISAVSWNSSEALTKIAEVKNSGDRWISLWWILAPTSGTHSIAVTFTGDASRASAISLTGVSALDTSGTNSGTSTTSISTTLSVASNAWTVSVLKEVLGTTVSWTNATERASTVGNGLHMADSGGALSSGSQTTTGAIGSSSTLALVTASFTPTGGGGGARLSRLSLLGAGRTRPFSDRERLFREQVRHAPILKVAA